MLLITIGRFRKDGKDAVERYSQGVIPLIDSAGGEVISRGGLQETVVGNDEDRPDLVAVIRFPSADAIRQFLSNSDYKRYLPDRDRAFSDIRSYIAADLLESSRQ